MKILLTVIASMMVSGAAMAACDAKSPHECNTEAECKGLETEGGSKYSFDASATKVKCTLASTGLVATKCTEAQEGGRGSKDSSSGAPVPAASGTASKAQ